MRSKTKKKMADKDKSDEAPEDSKPQNPNKPNDDPK